MMLPTNFAPVRLWRRARNWALRQKMYHGLSQGLLDEKRHIVAPTMPSPENPRGTRLTYEERQRLKHLNFWLGNGDVWWARPLSPAEYLRRKKLIRQIIEDIRREADLDGTV